ncbi:50S ribosomal protein L9 [Candidatus Sneabacter namystus]|uniref:Large ribosomal subunit protein bL9 n=1 Tax=Candidatus Sneabacter namystus TaxID=2601646 RepID=A0A5C0UIE3_9RICK|nr:50S ribosomal protein L9 [Candidatus Sneabacter namystus]QEK39547.1 50S ribosomal protein L9 [Candidatus Sneabacter namystus]
MKMDVVLLSSVRKLGNPGDVVSVKAGYGRYLVLSGIALRGTKENLESINSKKEEVAARNAEAKKIAVKVFDLLSGKDVTFIRNAGDDGRLFGSVTKRNITDAVNEYVSASECGLTFVLDVRDVVLSMPIRHLGVHPVFVSLHSDLDDVEILVNIAKSEELAKSALLDFKSSTSDVKEDKNSRKVDV